ncbi:hypothetical protein CIHG_08776 [Coccidioides immitis H538.4]|uniref:Uncharacterized protein n=1 Tax=Coccidioides immitis H538.4 TaxID=396776 RepID=A0A0J8S105_COCIT|nr:hypothetical protein CIHG_08776 [Coccidioides immitis H538.4]
MDVLQLKAREARKTIVIVKSGHRQPTTSAMDDIAFRDGTPVFVSGCSMDRVSNVADPAEQPFHDINYIMRFRPGILATGGPELRSPSAAASCNQGDRDIMRKNLNFLALCLPFPAWAWRTGPGI